jgi:hypothetical protein
MKRDIRKSVKFTPKEWAAVEKKAAQSKMKPATYMRHIAINGEVRIIDLERFDYYKRYLSKASNNLNQIAKVANSTNSIYENDILTMKSDFSEMKKFFDIAMEEYRAAG